MRPTRPVPPTRRNVRAWPRASGAALLCLPLVVGLGGCGQPTSPAPSTPTTVDVPIQPTIAPVGPDALETAPPDPSAAAGDSLYDASAALTGATCTAKGGSWSFSGLLTNANQTPETYTVGISLLRAADLSPVFTTEVVVTVPAGASSPVEAQAFHRAPAKGLTCLTGVTVKEQ